MRSINKDRGRLMPRILGVDLPNDRSIYISLSYLHGVGRRLALDLCHGLDLVPTSKASTLSDDQVAKLNVILDRDLAVEGSLRRKIQQDIGRLKEIKCYRGLRHRKGLPVRGQRTRTNSRTRKGVKKTVAGKKGVKDMKH